MCFNKRFSTLLFFCLTTLLFANCSPMRSSIYGSNTHFSTSAKQEIGQDGVLYSINPFNLISIDKDLTFFAEESAFSEPIKNILWDHNLNGTDFCEQKQGDTPWSVIINCPEAGSLNLFFIVEYESGVDESFIATVPVLTESVIDDDDDDIIPEPPTPLDGARLYSTSCAGCHGDGNNSTKKGRTVGQIQNAIGSNTGGMAILSTLSNEEITAIADYLGTL